MMIFNHIVDLIPPKPELLSGLGVRQGYIPPQYRLWGDPLKNIAS